MAALFAPSLDAAFDDIVMARGIARRASFVEGPFGTLGNMSDSELFFYERTLAEMQYDVFVDGAVMHEAFLSGGMPAINELERVGVIDDDAVAAWRMIADGVEGGNEAQIVEGNLLLLEREQQETLREGYEAMYHRSGTGAAFTSVMTMLYQPSIPGARSYTEVFPKQVSAGTPASPGWQTPRSVGTPRSILGYKIPSVSADLPSACIGVPGIGVALDTPLPDGNVAHRDDRTALIQSDTWPAFQEARAEDPEGLREMAATPVRERSGDYRLHSRLLDAARPEPVIVDLGSLSPSLVVDPALSAGIRGIDEVLSRTSADIEGVEC